MPFNLLDYIILAILMLSILSGLKRGFILAVTGIVNTLLAVIIAFTWFDDCLAYINEYWGLNIYLAEFIRNKLPLAVLSLDMPLINLPVSMGLINFKDAAEALAHFSLTVISFFLVFFLSLLILQLVARLLDKLFSGGILSWINNILGMIIVPVKNLLIIMIAAGLIFPVVELAARMGIEGAIITLNLIEHSLILGILLNIFATIKGLGIAVLGVGNYIN